MIHKFKFKPLLNFDGRMPIKSKIVHSDFSTCKAKLEVIAEYQYEESIKKFRYTFYLFNMPTQTIGKNDVWLSKFQRIFINEASINNENESNTIKYNKP